MDPIPRTFSDLELAISRVFDAPRRLVYDAWTKKEHVDQWFVPRDARLLEQDAEVRVGGKWHMAMEVPGDVYRAGGTYEAVIPNARLAFTHAWTGDDGEPEHWTLVTVDFVDFGDDKTLLIFQQAPMKSAESQDGHRQGWSQCFDHLDSYLATLPRPEGGAESGGSQSGWF